MGKLKKVNITKLYGVKIFVCENINGLPSQLISVSLKSKNPFTKEALDKFIESDKTIEAFKKVSELEGKELEIISILTDEFN